VFVQGGVGGLLCAIASWCAFHWPQCKVIGVEPSQAACLQASARAGHAVAVDGPLDSTLAGLRNREVSPLAFDSLLSNVDAFMAIDDGWAHDAMRALARPLPGDLAIAAGASGSAALGGLMALCRDASMVEARRHLGLDPSSKVLALITEGVTDPELWRSVVAGL
jgi:diaminopropionate ammonia-lyase